MKFFFDSEAIARATWCLLINNTVTPKLFIGMKFLESLILLFYALLISEAMLEQLEIDYHEDTRN